METCFKKVCLLTGDGKTKDVTVEWHVSHYDAGCLSGPPEHCYPPELELNIVSAWTEPDGKSFELTEAQYETVLAMIADDFNPHDYYDASP
jgi:hypothetical protein